MTSSVRRWLSLTLNVALFGVAALVMRKILTEYPLAEIVRSLHHIGWQFIWLSVALTTLGYAALVGYDYISLRLARHPIALRDMWRASFVSQAMQNSSPMAVIAGGGLRYRLFTRLGVSGAETAAVVAGNLMTFVLGLFAVAGLSFVIAPVSIPASLHLPVKSVRTVGALFLAAVIAAVILAGRKTGTIRIWRWKFDLPNRKTLGEQIGVSVADWLLSSAALYVLMLSGGPVPFVRFLSAFLMAQIVTQVVPLPGGIGVFEAAVLLMRPHQVTAPLATAALLVYRVVYYLVPLFAATAILALEASQRHRRDTSPAVRIAREVMPHVFAVLTFVAGLVLLVFNTLPERWAGFSWLGDLLRLAVIECSHFIGSLVGMGLLLLAFGLEKRLRSAFNLTVGLLLLGIPAALLRAVDLVSASILAVLLLLLLAARGEFDRTIPLSEEPLQAGWLVAVLVAVAGIGWFGIYVQVSHQYTSSLWWRFALDQDAPRTLRVTISVLMAALIFFGARLVSRARRRRRSPKQASAAHGRTRGRAARHR
ncbi:MAG: lysylphosphatidylglycerol synthase domain-containing protein [Gemmatimonadales bacterium]